MTYCRHWMKHAKNIIKNGKIKIKSYRRSNTRDSISSLPIYFKLDSYDGGIKTSPADDNRWIAPSSLKCRSGPVSHPMIRVISFCLFVWPVLATWTSARNFPSFWGKTVGRVSWYSSLIHYIIWEQHDWQIPALASRTHQTLDKTCNPSLGLRSSFRFIPQPYRSAAPTTDRPETTGQTTSANRPWPFSPGFSFPLYTILETIDSYYSAGYTLTLASGTVSFLLAAKVTRKAKDFIGNDQAHPQVG